MDSDQLLTVKNLSVSLEHRSILENLSFSLNSGDILSVLGPNGAGKTVLLKCLLGMLPYAGEIVWRPGIKIGYVPQRLPFIKDTPLSVRDFFRLKPTTEDEMQEILLAVGFDEEFLSRKIGDLSSGQFQRMLIGWSLIGKPDVLLFDEPMTGIDVGSEETIYNLLSQLKRKWYHAMVLVTHDLNVVYQFSSRVICMNRKLMCTGIPRDVLTPESFYNLYGVKMKYYQHHHG